MSSAIGILRWPPNVFWKATMYEYTTAMRGHLISKGVKFTDPMSQSEVSELLKIHKRRELKARMGGK